MTITPLPPYVWPGEPIPNVTPFNRRDGAGWQERFERLVEYFNKVVIPYINDNVGNLSDTFVQQVNLLIQQVNDAVAQVDGVAADAAASAAAAAASALEAAQYASDAEAIQDTAVTSIFQDTDSSLRQATDNAYADASTQATVETGRLSPGTLDPRFADKANQTEMDALSGQVSGLNTSVNTISVEVDQVQADVAPLPGRITTNENNLTWITNALDTGFRPSKKLVTYGHSFLAEQGLANPADYYARKIATFYGLTYPTDVTTNDLKRAVGGSHAEEAAWKMFGNTVAGGWTVGTDALLLVESLINTARLNGSDAITKRGAEWSIRCMAAMASSSAFFSASDQTYFTFSSTGWSYTPDAIYYGGTSRNTSTTGATVKFKSPGPGAHIAVMARKAGLAAAVHTITRSDTGEVLSTFNNVDQARSTISGNYVPALIKINVPAGVEVTVTATSGTLSFVGVFAPAQNPLPILFMKEPYLNNYAASTSFPNGSDAAIDYFNDIIDTVAAMYPNVYKINPNLYWTKANSATMVQADEVHPNVAGNDALFKAARDTVRQYGLAAFKRY